jgi:hypothetical protein
MTQIPIDWNSVNWLYVAVLGVFALVATLIGNVISFGHRGLAAILSGLVFVCIFVVWSYYPHHLPLPIRLDSHPNAPAAAAAPPPVPPAPVPDKPQKPANPVTTISPPPHQ